jgi:hypothetical protein
MNLGRGDAPGHPRLPAIEGPKGHGHARRCTALGAAPDGIDETGPMVDTLVRELRGSGETVFVAGGPFATLPWLGEDDAVCDSVEMLIPAYRTIEGAARARGLDPDHPPHLSKVTRTL